MRFCTRRGARLNRLFFRGRHFGDLANLNRKQIAVLVGVAPLNWDSGLLRGRRVI